MRILLQATLVVFLLTARAGAADFTVTVPVDISRMPVRYTKLQVKCWALCTNDATGGDYRNWVDDRTAVGQTGSKLNKIGSQLFTSWDTDISGTGVTVPGYQRSVEIPGETVQIVGIGVAERSIPSTTGEFQISIPVSFDAAPEYAPDNVRSYVCGMKVSVDGRQGIWEPRTLQNSDIAPLVADGTTAVFLSKGEFDNPAVDTSRPNPSCRRQ